MLLWLLEVGGGGSRGWLPPVSLLSHVALSPHSCHLAGPHPSLQPLALLGGPLGPDWKEGCHRGYAAPPGLSDSVRWTEVELGILGTGIAQTEQS